MVTDEADDKVLVESAQRDPRRFADLYARHFDRVYAFIARRVPARLDAQDLTAEVFQQALAALPRFEWRGVPFAAWLYRIAGNAVADHYQRHVRELPEDQRRVIGLRFGEDKSIADIARALGRSEGAVKQLQLRALRSLRARLDGDDG